MTCHTEKMSGTKTSLTRCLLVASLILLALPACKGKHEETQDSARAIAVAEKNIVDTMVLRRVAPVAIAHQTVQIVKTRTFQALARILQRQFQAFGIQHRNGASLLYAAPVVHEHLRHPPG